jgi:hypothetical protein
MIKPRRVRRVGHVSHIRKQDHAQVFMGNHKGRYHLGDLGINGSTLEKLILEN